MPHKQTRRRQEGRNLLATVTIIRLRATITITISRLETVRVEVLHGLESSIACASSVTNIEKTPDASARGFSVCCCYTYRSPSHQLLHQHPKTL